MAHTGSASAAAGDSGATDASALLAAALIAAGCVTKREQSHTPHMQAASHHSPWTNYASCTVMICHAEQCQQTCQPEAAAGMRPPRL